jgi:Tfp pilus assembly protein PilF
MTREDLALADQLYKKAVDLDPDFVQPYISRTFVRLVNVALGFSESPARDIGEGFEFAKRAVALDPTVGLAHTVMGRVYMQVRDLDRALEYGKRGVDLEPSGALSHAIYGHMLDAAGRPVERLSYMNRALRPPLYPSRGGCGSKVCA